MATVPVSKPMLPARICRIKSGSRIVPIPIALHPCRLAVKGGFARRRVENSNPCGAIQADVLGLTSECPRTRYRRTRFPGAYLRLCHQPISDSVHFSSEMRMQVRRFATSFPVGLLHPLQHAGLARRTPVSPSLGGIIPQKYSLLDYLGEFC